MFEINKKQWDLMKYYTRLFLMLFAVLGVISFIALISLMINGI